MRRNSPARAVRRYPVLLGFALIALAASGPGARADTALVIGNQNYTAWQPAPGCADAAGAMAQALSQVGHGVHSVSDSNGIQLRVAVNGMGQTMPGMIYVCSRAVVSGNRLFLLPADADPAPALAAPTQGVLLKALLRAVPAQGGTLLADLVISPDADIKTALADLQQDVPASQVMVLAIRNAAVGPAPLGQAFPSYISPAQSMPDWQGLQRALQAPGSGAQQVVILHAVPPAANQVTFVPPSSVPGPAAVTATSPPSAAAALTSAPPVAEAAKDRKPPRKPDEHRNAAAPSAERNQRVARLQAALQARGLYTGQVTGIEDAATKRAMRAFQSNAGDRPTGQLSPLEIITLLNSH